MSENRSNRSASKSQGCFASLMIVVEGSNEYDLQGKIIKLLRVSKGWSQQQLADKLLVSRGVVINIEKRGARDAVQLFAIASIFEVDINVFRAN